MKSNGDKFNKVIFHSHFCPKILIQKRTKNVHITILFQNSANHIIRELTSSAELQNVTVSWRTSIKCKTKKRHVQGVQKLLFLLIKYANVWCPRCRCHCLHELPIVCCYRCRFFNLKVINTQISWLIHLKFSAQDHCSTLNNSVSIIFLKGQISILTCTTKKHSTNQIARLTSNFF